MFAYVKDGSIVSMPRGNVGINIGDLQYSADILQLNGQKVKEMPLVFTQ